MRFWASAEVYQPAFLSLDRARRCVEPYLNTLFKKSILADVDMKVDYVPIVMPVDMRNKYKERSRASVKKRNYLCAPQLEYDVFVTGSIKDQLQEYLRGISLTTPHLHKFGLTSDQIITFKTIIATAVEVILIERPDETRH